MHLRNLQQMPIVGTSIFQIILEIFNFQKRFVDKVYIYMRILAS